MRLLLIRHGETDSNVARLLDTGHPGADLNPKGLEQAAALALKVAGEPITAVYSSDLVRARQTAEPLAAALALDVHQLPGFREIFAGELDMATDWEPYVRVLQTWSETPEAKLDGGEDAYDFMSRFDAAVAEIAATGASCVAVVSHGAALRTWVPTRATNIDHDIAAAWHLDNTAVLELDGDPESGWRLVSWAGNAPA